VTVQAVIVHEQLFWRTNVHRVVQCTIVQMSKRSYRRSYRTEHTSDVHP